MDVPAAPRALSALAVFVRHRLAEVSDTLGPLWRRDEVEVLPAQRTSDGAVASLARQFAGAVVGAAAPFAPTSYARVRLLRQMHAAGLLTDDELRRTTTIIEVAAVVDQPGTAAGESAATSRGSED